MAKGNVMLGTLRGSVGDMTFSRQNGNQVVKAKATTVKNPRSERQMVQRMILATVGKAYSAMKAICDHSFEGKQPGAKTMAYFESENLKNLRAAIAYNPVLGTFQSPMHYNQKSQNWITPNTYKVAEGSLPGLPTDALLPESIIEEEYGLLTKYIPYFNATGMDPVNEGTVLEQLGGAYGDWFTFVYLIENLERQGTSGQYIFGFSRFVVSRDANQNLILVNTLNAVPGTKSMGDLSKVMTYDNKSFLVLDISSLYPELNFTEDCGVIASALIHSRESVNGWQRSDAALFLRNTEEWGAFTHFSGLLEGIPDITASLETWMEQGSTIGEGKYVLNGGASFSLGAGHTPSPAPIRILPPTIGGTDLFQTESYVNIETAYTGSVIRYTTDGTDPNENSTVYSAPFRITQTTLVKARVWLSGRSSSVATLKFRQRDYPEVAPVITPNQGTYPDGTIITMKGFDPRLDIRFNTDGTDPDGRSVIYNPATQGELFMSGSGIGQKNYVLKAAMFNDLGERVSAVTVANYVVNLEAVAEPLIVPNGGEFEERVNVNFLAYADFENALVYYTIDGSVPTAETGTQYDGEGEELVATEADRTVTVKAVAVTTRGGQTFTSPVASATFQIKHVGQ